MQIEGNEYEAHLFHELKSVVVKWGSSTKYNRDGNWKVVKHKLQIQVYI